MSLGDAHAPRPRASQTEPRLRTLELRGSQHPEVVPADELPELLEEEEEEEEEVTLKWQQTDTDAEEDGKFLQNEHPGGIMARPSPFEPGDLCFATLSRHPLRGSYKPCTNRCTNRGSRGTFPTNRDTIEMNLVWIFL